MRMISGNMGALILKSQKSVNSAPLPQVWQSMHSVVLFSGRVRLRITKWAGSTKVTFGLVFETEEKAASAKERIASNAIEEATETKIYFMAAERVNICLV